MQKRRPSVFIGSSAEGLPVAQAIQSNLDHCCEAAIWCQGVFGLSSGTLATLVEQLDTFDFAVLVLTPDDITVSRDNSSNSPRDNVLLELGMFIGAIGQKRTFYVIDRAAGIKLPSDLAGITPASYELHSNGNLEASLGAATTKIQEAIKSAGLRTKLGNSEAFQKDTQFQIIHDLLETVSEQFMILMYEQSVEPIRGDSFLGPEYNYTYHTSGGRESGKGKFSIDNLCNRLADADLLRINLRRKVSLTDRGVEFAEWLIARGHKAEYFQSGLGSWGTIPKRPLDDFPDL